jgi:hypothetical protein
MDGGGNKVYTGPSTASKLTASTIKSYKEKTQDLVVDSKNYEDIKKKLVITVEKLTINLNVSMDEIFNNILNKMKVKEKNDEFDLSDLIFTGEFNQPISVGILPHNFPNFHKLTLEGNFNQPIIASSLPDSLTHLTFGPSFNQPIKPNILPNKLTNLTIRFLEVNTNNYDKINMLQIISANHLHINGNLDINNILNKIRAGSYDLTKLTFSDDFNQPIDINRLPTTLTQITFGANFNQRIGTFVIVNNLSSLRSLTFGANYDSILDPVYLPKNLSNLFVKRLMISNNINITKRLSVEELHIYENYDIEKIFKILEKIRNTPFTLTKIIFDEKFNQSVDLDKIKEKLRHLQIKSLEVKYFDTTPNTPNTSNTPNTPNTSGILSFLTSNNSKPVNKPDNKPVKIESIEIKY